VHAPPVDVGSGELAVPEEAVVVGALAAAVVVSIRPKLVKVTAPVCVAVWAVGFGWVLADTMA
jgi:hypothetical protein